MLWKSRAPSWACLEFHTRSLNLLMTILCHIVEEKLIHRHFNEMDVEKEIRHSLLDFEKVKKEEASFTKINGSLKN